jgi:hypothetical protein
MRHEELAGLGANLGCEAPRAFADQELVRQPLEHLPRDAHRVEEPLQRSDGAGAQHRPIHDGCVELDLAEEVRPAAAADGPDVLVLLDEPDSGLDRIEGRGPLCDKARGDGDAGGALVVGDDDYCCCPGAAGRGQTFDLLLSVLGKPRCPPLRPGWARSRQTEARETS